MPLSAQMSAGSASFSSQRLPDYEQISGNLDLLISLHLHAWPALTYAIQNAWGGSPQISRDKRDWFAGAISELITPDPKTNISQITHVDDLEEVLLQVMVDEFEVVVDDESAASVAEKIWRGRDKILQGDFGDVQDMQRKWEEKRLKMGGVEEKVVMKQGEDQEGDETDWDDDEDEWDGFQDQHGNTQMDEAPALVDAVKREKAQPEVDEEGFTMVVKKNRR